MTKKTCIKCKVEKESPADFYKQKDYIRNICRECFKKITRIQSEKRKLLKKEANPNYSYSREYYAKNKEKFAEYRRRFLEKNPGYMKRFRKKPKKEA